MSITNTSNKTEILLESGTNEMEIMEFTISDQLFGINVAKVIEIMQYNPVKPMQNSHPDIEGIFKPRDKVITVVDLAKYLNLPPSEDSTRDIFIIAAFNQQSFAFHVHSVVGIDRISWQNIQKPDRIIYGGSEGVATGIAEFQDRLITILDFEKIVSEISPDIGVQTSDVEKLGPRHRNEVPILIVEDSQLLSKLILESLHMAGFTNIIKTENGQEAWDYLLEIKASGNPVHDFVSLIVSDIEMPLMDGHRLTKLIKEDPVLMEIPVVLFSSLINKAMYLKGQQVGADEQLSKPEIASLVTVIDRLLQKKMERMEQQHEKSS